MKALSTHGTSSLEPVWIGIDLGTQSVRAVAVTRTGGVVTSVSQALVSRRDGKRHTQDPLSWWKAVCACCRGLSQAVEPARMRAVAVAATSGTVLLTDNHLAPVTEALMYDDGRAEAEAREVEKAGKALWDELGYTPQPSWALPKLLWMLRHGTVDARELHLAHQNDFIHAQLAGHRVASDSSNSLKTGYDQIRRQWPVEIFEALGIAPSLLPEVVSPGTVIAEVSAEAALQSGLPEGLAIVAGMTDGCAAQIASGATELGSWNAVLGTTLVLKGVTRELLRDPLGVMYSHRSADGLWLPGGASSTGAGALTRDLPAADLGRFSIASESLGKVSAVVTYPLVSEGERFPFHAPAASGFRLGTPEDDEDLYRSILQGVCFIERLSFDYVEMLGAPMHGDVTISGGAVKSEYWNKLRATALERPLFVAEAADSAFGMAVLAASPSSSFAEAVSSMVPRGRLIEPPEDFLSIYGRQYERLLTNLVDRGWLPLQLAQFSLGKLNASRSAEYAGPREDVP